MFGIVILLILIAITYFTLIINADYPPALPISEVTSTTNPPSFVLTIQPPSARAMCVGGQYLLTIRSSSPDSSEQNVTRVNIPVANSPVTISYAVNSTVVPSFDVCNNNYSFEIAVAVNPTITNQQDGEFNYGGENYINIDHVMRIIYCVL